ncbi:hypothetical protein NC652_018196 [Populus alba x Populus x berolinensis]|nr:hypothetical protein NC652_018196 [Populus alba x Populus x berolinensis]
MTDFSMVNRRYSYLPECKWLLEATDMHHVVVRKSNAKDFFVCLSALIVVPNARFDKSITNLLWGFLLSVLLVKVMKVEELSIALFHLQDFETLLLECASPVTCYWSLSLLLRGEAELVLVFKTRPGSIPRLGLEATTPNSTLREDVSTHPVSRWVRRRPHPIPRWAWMRYLPGLGRELSPTSLRLGVKLKGILCKYIFQKELKKLRGLEVEELRPHVKMLILIWNALCDASGIKEGADTWEDAT